MLWLSTVGFVHIIEISCRCSSLLISCYHVRYLFKERCSENATVNFCVHACVLEGVFLPGNWLRQPKRPDIQTAKRHGNPTKGLYGCKTIVDIDANSDVYDSNLATLRCTVHAVLSMHTARALVVLRGTSGKTHISGLMKEILHVSEKCVFLCSSYRKLNEKQKVRKQLS